MKLFRLYLDESGDHTYKSLDDPAKRYLGLTGCIIEKDYYQNNFQPELEQLKKKHFTYDPDDPVIFHREDMINLRRAFWRFRDEEFRKTFDEDLLEFLKKQKYIIISVVIDKKTHRERYREAAFHPYHYCVAVILERYCGFLHFNHAKGDFLAESRGKNEDLLLKNAFSHVYVHGTMHRKAKFFQSVLTSKEIKIKPKSANVAGLQLADILAYPCKREILKVERRIAITAESFNQKILEVIQAKYNRQVYQNRITGYGRIFLK